MAKKILVVLTSHDKLGDTGKPTGYWEEEFAAPYYVFVDAGHEVTLASPKGGEPPCDPGSKGDAFQTAATKRFREDADANEKMKNTAKLSDIKADDFDAVFYPGGHGPVYDLRYDAESISIIESLAKADKPIGAVCHGPAVLIGANKADGTPLVGGGPVTGFSNTEEAAVQLDKVVPYSLEDELKSKGGEYSKGDDWGVHVATNGKLVTGQNPGSSEATAKKLLEFL